MVHNEEITIHSSLASFIFMLDRLLAINKRQASLIFTSSFLLEDITIQDIH